MESNERVVIPEDPATVDRRLRELEAACREALKKLPPEERILFREYEKLLRRREDRQLLNAYNSGIQVGQRRAQKGSMK